MPQVRDRMPPRMTASLDVLAWHAGELRTEGLMATVATEGYGRA
jgi:hypothetical protein